MAINAATVLDRVKKLRQEIHDSTMRIRTVRQQANQLFTRRELQLYMQLAADTFSENPENPFDIYRASIARRPTPVGLAGYIVEFRRAVDEAIWQSTPKLVKHRISLSVLQKRIEYSVLLWIGRLNVKLQLGANAQLPEDFRKDLEQAQREIDGELPCAATKKSGKQTYHCDTVRHMHLEGAPHASAQGVRWDGDFTPDSSLQDACKLVDTAESAFRNTKTLDVKEIRRLLSEVRRTELIENWWLNYADTFYRVCGSCIVELPTEVLSCGHIICAMCAKEEAKTRSPETIVDLTCPICFSPAKWFPKDLPPLAGYRILSLDGGGGVRGIVELLSLAEIMSFFPGMQIGDLFDIIIGTSTGGIIALALTVHEFNEQPKSLPDVTELFQDLSRKVFSSEMLRPGADDEWVLRFCQFVRIYDTKYKNTNLLKLLAKHLGEKPLLLSCVGGPRVIVTSCDGDDDLAAAWFTSYNRPMREKKLDGVRQEPLRETTDQPTHQSGRVFDNHLFSAKDAAAATSAACTYLPSYRAGNRVWIDGGLQYNCPVEVAIKEAQIMWPKHRASVLISLGCGQLLQDKKTQHSDSQAKFMRRMSKVVTDPERQWTSALNFLNKLQPDSSGCSLRLNPTIELDSGDKCELDCAMKIPFLRLKTNQYLAYPGRANVEKAAQLLFAALFYLDVEIDEDLLEPKLDLLRIRSRAALPLVLQEALINASRSAYPPFVVTGAKSEFLWAECKWDQDVMNLPFSLRDLPMAGPLTVTVKLHMSLPRTTALTDPLPISGMPCSLRDQ